MSGPLQGVKVVEMSGLGPAPFACMMLADLGAEVICVDRLTAADTHGPVEADIFRRGKRSMALDLKQPSALQAVLQLIDSADVVVEGFRPGVMERLGLGPQVCLARNSRLVYGRMTGWGQSGPMAAAAGHDINYIALSGALHAIGTIEQPIAPLNLVGDFGGGGMLLAVGVLAAVLSARATGKGQVVDAAMTDGSALLMTMIYGWKAAGQWVDRRGVNMLDGGAHFYGTYQCSDGKWIAVGSIEPQFYALLVEKAGLQGVDLAAQRDSAAWPQMRERLAEVFARRTRAHWCEVMEGSDVCFSPVLSMTEAPHHPHNAARQTFVEVQGVTQPAPAPRFSETPASIDAPPARAGAHTIDILRSIGLGDDAIGAMRSTRAIA